MPLTLAGQEARNWEVRRIAVIGPGIVGMPMAALLAEARVREGTDQPARVVVVQRPSPTSGWKVDAINAGRSPIGGVEPGLDAVVAGAAAAGLLSATHDTAAVRDADLILVCVQTDKAGFAPDYDPLFAALDSLGAALRDRPAGNIPVVVFESTLAPSSMATVVRERFARHGLEEGRDVLLGNSPNRVMPGRLVERVRDSDKLVGGLHPATPDLISRIYSRIVTGATLHRTSSLTAEVVKTLENAYRDVRIAYSAEVARWCDANDVDFWALREAVNERLDQRDAASADPNAVPSGGLLVPTIGVGGHCLPKDGILLYWRWIEAARPVSGSLILGAREVNDASPLATIALAERRFGALAGRTVTLLGAAYRFNSEDTRNSPTLVLAGLLRDRGCRVRIHDPYVKPDDQNVVRLGFTNELTAELDAAVEGADLVIACSAHAAYVTALPPLLARSRRTAFVDGCNLFPGGIDAPGGSGGIGRGRQAPPAGLVATVVSGFAAVECGVAREVLAVCEFLNARYAASSFERVEFDEVRRLAATCVTGCAIPEAGPAPLPPVQGYGGLVSSLVGRAEAGSAG